MNTVVRQEFPWGWRISMFEPRLCVSKNDALELQYLDGYRRAMTQRQGAATNTYNQKVKAVRDLVCLCAKPIGRIDGLVDIRVSFNPSTSWDDDAGALVATWIVDGLTDAGLWTKDRRVLRWLSVRTVRDQVAPAIVVEIERVSS